MRKDIKLGRPLLAAAMELLTDFADRMMVARLSTRCRRSSRSRQSPALPTQGLLALLPMLRMGDLSPLLSCRLGRTEGDPPPVLRQCEPDLLQSTLTSHGVMYTAVRVLEATTPSAVWEKPESALKGKGGRPVVHDWIAFGKEVVRLALLDGFSTRRELTAHMRDWCAQKWANPPGDEAIRQKVIDLCPDGVPSE